jgi:hypothetical protein
MNDPFLTHADTHAVAPQRKRWAKQDAAPMVPTEQEKKLREVSHQLRIYKRWKRSLLKEALHGPHAASWRILSRLLRKLTMDDADELVDHVRLHWAAVDRHTQQLVLSTVAQRITRLRIQNGYEPFDDALPGEQPNVYLTVRSILLGLPLPV